MECALKYLCRDDLLEKLNAQAEEVEEAEDGEEVEESAESAEIAAGPTYAEDEIQTLLYCVNAVEDELARYYFPLKKSEALQSATGEYPFESFEKRPLRILGVTADGKKTEFESLIGGIRCDKTEICVQYEYSPYKKDLDGESEYDGVTVGANLIAKGAASEFCLIRGETSCAELWESKYRQEIDLAQKSCKTGCAVPPRRWV